MRATSLSVLALVGVGGPLNGSWGSWLFMPRVLDVSQQLLSHPRTVPRCSCSLPNRHGSSLAAAT
eukprot:10492224-Ditylum_brightwellii.AAC.1